MSFDPETSSDSDEETDGPFTSSSVHPTHPGIDIDTIAAAERVKPSLAHRVKAQGSILALVLDDEYLIGGLEGGDIVVWSLETFEKVCTVHAHQESVLGLFLSEDKQLLFSVGADSVVTVWSSQNLSRLFAIHSHHDIGDIFCVTYSETLNTLFCGSQNQSIQWLDFGSNDFTPQSATWPSNRKHRFFDSLGPGGSTPPRSQYDELSVDSGKVVTFHKSHYKAFAHYSYVYCMLLATVRRENVSQEVLVSGGGDGAIKIWSLDSLHQGSLELVHKFRNSSTIIVSLASNDALLYAGLGNGGVHVYNLDSAQLVQKVDIGKECVSSIQVMGGVAFCGTYGGMLKQFNSQFTKVGSWSACDGKLLASAVCCSRGKGVLVTGGNDALATFWDVSQSIVPSEESLPHGTDQLVDSLREFVSFRSVSGNPKCAGQCNEAVTFLRKQFDLYNVRTALLPTTDGLNPVLLAKFDATSQSKSKKTVLFYGHYDVVDAEYKLDSKHSPFDLHSLNGYLYGRGVTDNKGPILAALYAVADLVQNKSLDCDTVFLIEGEEEAGSRGFAETVRKHRKIIGDVDFILLSNSYWLDDHIPCLTYGMRGVIHASITISSEFPDRHSGMHGKAMIHEPLKDLTIVLSRLLDETGVRVQIPGFYSHVAPLEDSEKKRYTEIATALLPSSTPVAAFESFIASLTQRWREPNLTIHRIEVPESKAAVTISSSAKADLSLRIVPSQDAETIAANLKSYIDTIFQSLQSGNTLQTNISAKADAWMGDPTNTIFQALDHAVRDVWRNPNENSSGKSRGFLRSSSSTGSDSPITTTTSKSQPKSPLKSPRSPITAKSKTPALTISQSQSQPRPQPPLLYIREGGSIPAIAFLEREFGAPAAMFPCGQASDNAHLEDERIRVLNLTNGREVFKRVLGRGGARGRRSSGGTVGKHGR